MATVEAVRAVGLALPRSREVFVRDRRKFRVGAIVYAAFSADERTLGFGFPKEERDALVASDPDTYFLPRASDLRFHWVCAHLERLDDELVRELVVDAWRMTVPRMLHHLPDLPPPTAAAWRALEDHDWVELRPLLHPYLHWQDRDVTLRGRVQVLAHLAEQSRPRPPTEVEIRDDQIYRWTR